MGDMNFPSSPVVGEEFLSWTWDGDKWTRPAPSNPPYPTVEKVATGTLANGDAVVLNDDGTVSVVEETVVPADLGAPVVVNSEATYHNSAVYDSVANKVVITYASPSKGYGVVGTVSGDSITFGTPMVFNSATLSYLSTTFDPVASRVVIAYRDGGSGLIGKAVVGEVSGDSISFGTSVGFNNNARADNISATYDPVANRVVIAYKDHNSYFGTAIVGNVRPSNNSILFGTPVVFNSATANYTSSVYDSVNNKVVIAYQDVGSSNYGTAIVGTVSGDSISFGTSKVFSSGATYYISAVYDPIANKVVIAYRDIGNSSYGTAVVGTVSGDSINFGTPAVFTTDLKFISSVYDSVNNKVVIAYQDVGNSKYGTLVVGTVSGDSISFGTPSVFNSRRADNISATYDPVANRVVIAYTDGSSGGDGTAITYSPGGFVTNLTADNFEGFSSGTYSDGDTAKVLVNGSIAGQSGLTTAKYHYVQGDGTVDTDSGGVFAGTALSSNELIVEGSNNG